MKSAGRPAAAGAAGVLTREWLAGDDMLRMVARSSPGLRLLSAAERAASLERALALRPTPGQGVWIFAYGSLIWNPAIEIDQTRPARIQGWHRRFCLSVSAGRGSPEQPGLVLGLDRGGACRGLALHVAEEKISHELPLLWRREMVADSYAPRWVALHDAGGVFGHAIAFTVRRDRPGYAGGLSEAELVARLASARGALGSSAEYLLHTREGLRRLGIRDPYLEHLARAVEGALVRPPGP